MYCGSGCALVLDGMPGKQMAIDADLNAGLIAEDEAKRRAEVTQEADYGSMDGASSLCAVTPSRHQSW